MTARMHSMFWLTVPGLAILTKMAEYLNAYPTWFITGSSRNRSYLPVADSMKLPVVEYNYISSEDEETLEKWIEELKAEATRYGLTPAAVKPMAQDGQYHAFVFLMVELPGQPHSLVDFQVSFDQGARAQSSTSEWLWDATGGLLSRAASSFSSLERQRIERRLNARGGSGGGDADDLEQLIVDKPDRTLSVSDQSIQEKERFKIAAAQKQMRVSVSANIQKAKKSLAQQRSASFHTAPKTLTFDALVAQKLGKEQAPESKAEPFETKAEPIDALPMKAPSSARSSLRKSLASPRQSIRAASKSQAAVALTKTLKGRAVGSLTRKRLNEVIIECSVRGTVGKGSVFDLNTGFSLPLILFDDGSHSMKNLQFIHRDAHMKEGSGKQYILWFIALLKVAALYVVACGLTQLNSNYSYEVAIKIIGIPVMINRLLMWLWNQYKTVRLLYKVNRVAKKEKQQREAAERKADAESGVDNSKRRRRKWWRGALIKAAKLFFWCASKRDEDEAAKEKREKDETEAVVDDLCAKQGVEVQLQRWAARASTFRQLLTQGQADLPFLNMDNLIEIFLSPVELPDQDVLIKMLLEVSDLDLSDPMAQEQLDELEKKIDKWVKRICKELGYDKKMKKKEGQGAARKDLTRTPTLGLKWEVVGKVGEARPSDLGTELIAHDALAERLQEKSEFSEEEWGDIKEKPLVLSADNFIKVGDSYLKPSVPPRGKLHGFREALSKFDGSAKATDTEQPATPDAKADSPAAANLQRIRNSPKSAAQGSRKSSSLFPATANLGKSQARKQSSPACLSSDAVETEDKSLDVNPDVKTDAKTPAKANMAKQLSWMSQQEEASFSPSSPKAASPEEVAVDIPPQAEEPRSASRTKGFLRSIGMFARTKKDQGETDQDEKDKGWA